MTDWTERAALGASRGATFAPVPPVAWLCDVSFGAHHGQQFAHATHGRSGSVLHALGRGEERAARRGDPLLHIEHAARR